MYKFINGNRVHKPFIKHYCSKSKANEKLSYSHTVLLPKTKFPLRIEGKKLVDRDNSIGRSPSFLSTYEWQRQNLQGTEFVLHDGPPYANGTTHMGHAMNKILKDVVLRTKVLDRRKVNYIPGWDCHGLPIELKAVSTTKELQPIEIRQKARHFASNTLEKQKDSFLSWGICGDWKNVYTTYSPNYVKNQIRKFYELYEKKLVYRDVKPVYWSPSTKTALAEAELEYNENHKSTTIILKLQLKKISDVLNINKKIFALIWTTTPWTLPSNQAICYNPKLSYSVVENMTNAECYLICTNLIDDISKKINVELKILKTFEGHLLKDTSYLHPVNKSQELTFLPGSHPVDSKGTGLVHTAPAHGTDDFVIALQHKLPVKCMVDELGKYTEEAGDHLNKLNVLSDGLTKVLNMVQKDIVHVEDFIHSYPYDWRTKKPVILRASKQWFIDTNSIKQRAMELLDDVTILPKINSEMHRSHFRTQLQKRPYWCISRQRCWGVPIPVFYKMSSDDVIVTRDTIDHFCELIDTHGCDFWWCLKDGDILPKSTLMEHNVNVDDLKKGADILDIWFDSGMSWSSVLAGEKVADMYLEGVDQFTGWFQSSLLTSVALRDKAPYKTVYVHGFAVDENGLKMSKSLGNIVNPKDILEGTKAQRAYGVDTLRWWVACHANQDTVTHISNNVLQASNDEVQKVRSVLRFALAALSDYNEQEIEYDDFKLIDKYILHLLALYQKKIQEYLNDYQFHKIGTAVINILTNEISALYYTSIKDRLYCEPEECISRRSSQFVLNILFFVVTRSIAAIVPHLAEELYGNLPYKKCSSFFQTTEVKIEEKWISNKLEEAFNFILEVKKEFNKKSGALTLNKKVVLWITSEQIQFLECFMKDGNPCNELLDILQVAEVEIKNVMDNHKGFSVEIEESCFNCCPRCRRHLSLIKNDLCQSNVDLAYNDEVKTQDLIVLSQNPTCKFIKYLNLTSVRSVSANDIQKYVQKMTNLEELFLMDTALKMNLVTNEFFLSFPKIRKMTLSIGIDGFIKSPWSERCPYLEQLHVQFLSAKDYADNAIDFLAANQIHFYLIEKRFQIPANRLHISVNKDFRQLPLGAIIATGNQLTGTKIVDQQLIKFKEDVLEHVVYLYTFENQLLRRI